MTMTLSEQEFVLFRDYIAEVCGTSLEKDKSYLIQSRLAPIAKQNNCSSFMDLYQKLKISSDKKIQDKIVDAITTHETFWFRDEGPWKIVRNILLPRFVDELNRGTKNMIRIWCSGCATGQEPYSLAMLLHDEFEDVVNGANLHQKVDILATDISPSSLFVGVVGRYNQQSIQRGLSQQLCERHFTFQQNGWQIKDKIKKMVRFERLNLLDDFSAIGSFDLIFCRNVLIYFASSTRQHVSKRIVARLYHRGVLVLGSLESLAVPSEPSDMMMSLREHDGHYYHVASSKDGV